MTKEIIAFVSLGFRCGGPQPGGYGKFTVDFTEEEIAAIDSIVNDNSIRGWKRTALEERYPEIDEKIQKAGRELAERITLKDCMDSSLQYLDIARLIKEDVDSGQFKWGKAINEKDEALLQEWEKWEDERVMNMASEERFEFVRSRYGLIEDITIDDICGELCYYLCKEEIPSDYTE